MRNRPHDFVALAIVAVICLFCVQASLRRSLAEHWIADPNPAGLELAVQLTPGNGEGWIRLGQALAGRGEDPQRAMEAIRRGVELGPYNPEAWIALGLQTEGQGDPELAEQHFKKAFDVDRGFDTRWSLANYYLRQDNQPPAAPHLADRENELRFVIVSFYNYFRNFETVFRALALLRETTDLNIRLLLTTELRPGLRLGGYDSTKAYELMHELGIANQITCLGHVPHANLPTVHASVDGLIAAGYVESFSFTVVEGMAAGLPVLASDIPVHREVGADAALYFRPLDPVDLASQWERLARDPRLRQRLAAAGRERARLFDWASHFETVFRVTTEVTA